MRFARALWLLFMGLCFHSMMPGCNAILDNEEGKLAQPVVILDAADDQPLDQGAPPEDANGDVVILDAASDAPICPFGKKACFGACVDRTDTAYGCGAVECDPCGSAHASAVACGPVNNDVACVLTCEPGWADCDQNPKNGCETDLSQPEHCGSCTTVCSGDTSKCSGQGGAFTCAATCAFPLTECGDQCVNTSTDPNNCNTCGNVCPGTSHGVGKCVNKVCTLQCDINYHRCGTTTVCAADNDVTKCGAACRNCTTSAPPHSSAVACQGGGALGSCVYACTQDSFGQAWRDCNSDLNLAGSNGCETNVDNDSNNCRFCGTKCTGSGTQDGGPQISDSGPSIDSGTGIDSGGTEPVEYYCCHQSCVSMNQSCF